jgi:hypothetical protein
MTTQEQRKTRILILSMLVVMIFSVVLSALAVAKANRTPIKIRMVGSIRKPPIGERCLNMDDDFNCDSPELRLYLSSKIKGVCFTTKWQYEPVGLENDDD